MSLVTRCRVTRWKKLLVTRCKIRSLLIAEVARCRNSLVTRCKSCSLQKFTRYLLQNSLGTRYRSYSLQKITRYSLQKFLVVKKSFAARWNSHKSINLGESLVFSIYSNVFLKTKIFKVGPSQHITLKPPVSRTLSNTIIYKWVKSQQLLALSQRNK